MRLTSVKRRLMEMARRRKNELMKEGGEEDSLYSIHTIQKQKSLFIASLPLSSCL